MAPAKNIKRGYCVYWIPTNSSSKKVLSLIKKEHISLNDSFRLTSTALNTDEQTGTVKINMLIEAISDNTTIYKFNVTFQSEEYNKDGLLCLSYSVPTEYIEEFKLLKHIIYRHIKYHFHRHIYHENESGEILKGYYSDDKVDPTADNNNALKFYLEEINNILNIHNEYLLAIWHLVQKNSNNINDNSYAGNLGKREYSERCQQVIDQISFYNTLIYSEQNKGSNIQCAGAEMTPMRQLTREINNNIIAMRTLNERAKAIFYNKTIEINESMQKELTESAKTSSRLGWISLALGLLSILLTIWQSCISRS